MRKVYLFLTGIIVIATMSSCEKIFCTASDDGGTVDSVIVDECTTNYSSSNFGLTYDYGHDSGLRYVDLNNGSTSETENTTTDLALTGSDSDIGFIGINGTTFSGTNLKGTDWETICDKDLLTENRGGEPTMTSIATTNAGGTGTSLYYFKNSKGKYGLIYIKHIYDFTISDKWSMDQIEVKIQK